MIKVTKITVERILDENPDLSYLGEYTETPIENTEDRFTIDRDEERGYTSDSREYHYFIAENVENKKQALENYYRMESYNNQNWCMIGIKAEAEININRDTIQHIHSGGLWGIESDSDESYLKEIEQEQIDDCIAQLKALKISVPKDIEIERESN